jgi:tetratricopeptide (TPR) repeat protein
VRTEQYPVEQVRARLVDAGTELFSAGQYGAARAVLLSALELGDESTDTLYRLAYSEAATGNLPASAEHYEACRDKLTARAEPDRALLVKCLTNAGAVAQRRGELEQAAELYERAVALDERHAPAYFNLGVLYLQSLERPEDGVEALTRHIALGGERAIAARRLITEAQQSQGE